MSDNKTKCFIYPVDIEYCAQSSDFSSRVYQRILSYIFIESRLYLVDCCLEPFRYWQINYLLYVRYSIIIKAMYTFSLY
jgi:hypothetical protein